MRDGLASLAFLAFAALTVVSAVMVVAMKNLLHAAVSLFFCLSGVAGLYLLIGADFLGVAQLIVYAGGILVLIIFGVFLTARIYDVKPEIRSHRLTARVGGAVAALVFLVIFTVLSKTTFPMREVSFEPTTAGLGTLLLTKYLLPFELVSVLLLFAMVGAAILVRKELGGK